MSNVLKAFQSKTRRPETFFGQVVSYGKSPDGSDGVLVDVVGTSGEPTGTQRLVVLDPNAQIDLGPGKERPGISKFASSGKSHTPPGGILRIETAVETGNVWQARWISGAVHKPGAGRVFTAEARVGTLMTSEKTGRAYRALDVLNLDAATPVASSAALRDAISNAIRDAGAGSAMVRLTLGEQTRAVTVGGKGETPDARVEAAFANETVQAVAAALDNGGTSSQEVVEVIPVSRFWFGGDSAQSPRLDKSFVLTTEEGRHYSRGYRPLLVTLQNHDDGEGVMVTGVAFADGTPFARHGHPSPVSESVASPVASAPAESEPEDEFPDVDLEGLVQRQAPGPGLS